MRRALVTLLSLVVSTACWPTACWAQLLGESAGESDRFGPPVVYQFRVGAIIEARNGGCRDLRAMVAVPLDTPEQTVRLLERDVTPHVEQLEFRELQGGAARQMLIGIPRLAAGEEARAVLTFEVRTSPTLAPADEVANRLEVPRRLPSNVRRYLGNSPFIETRNGKIKRLAKTIQSDVEANTGSDDPTDWQRVEAIYDHVLDNITYAEGPDTSALETLEEEVADCHGRSALFVALCRASGVPARMVWVHKHCYPEFYLEDPTVEDDESRGLWYPAESAGVRAFGEMPLERDVPVYRAILQRGDSFRVPERKGEKLRYATDFLTGKPMPGSGKPKVRYIREVVGQEDALP